MRSFIVFLCLVPTLLFARQTQLETQLKEAIKGKKAEIGIAVIIDGKDTVTVNNDIHYPLMSVFKFHQALALADYMGKQKQSLETRLPIKKSDLKPDTYSPLRDKYPPVSYTHLITNCQKCCHDMLADFSIIRTITVPGLSLIHILIKFVPL